MPTLAGSAPRPGAPKRLTFLKDLVSDPHIEVGDYTYYNNFDFPCSFPQNVLVEQPGNQARLRIGRFCMIASGVKFMLSGGSQTSHPSAAHGILVGHDVWIGYQAQIMPGVRIGNGAIVATKSVVTQDVPPFAVVAGNPATVVHQRFPPALAARLQQLAWWNWSPAKLARHRRAIHARNLEYLVQTAA
ncbi:CatB-related O-acetyltransferase [Hymenobacter guriensis]|uniref:CatB-related O-acetyltransferase n=1 Tax=Hymenobacter guriensis TaxID=2793065 RepID=A0ABS0KZT3_9BACT|nr:CatB-related O-acetyltransferase [Hymenobacter guriensis]MBG8552647.1 CatB-related O-acetyltransferase [Hymenobacter guriensis]